MGPSWSLLPMIYAWSQTLHMLERSSLLVLGQQRLGPTKGQVLNWKHAWETCKDRGDAGRCEVEGLSESLAKLDCLGPSVNDNGPVGKKMMSRRRICFDGLNWVEPLHSRLTFRRRPKNATKQTAQNVACQGSSQFNWFLRAKGIWGVISFGTLSNESRLRTSTWQTNYVQRMTDLSLELNTNNTYYSKRKQPLIWFFLLT